MQRLRKKISGMALSARGKRSGSKDPAPAERPTTGDTTATTKKETKKKSTSGSSSSLSSTSTTTTTTGPKGVFFIGDSIVKRSFLNNNFGPDDKARFGPKRVDESEEAYKERAEREKIAKATTSSGHGMLYRLGWEVYKGRVMVEDRGYGGWNTDAALHYFDQIVPDQSERKLDVVSVAFGANDASVDVPENRKKGKIPNQAVPPSRFKSNLGTIVDKIRERQPDCRIVLATPSPCLPSMMFDSEFRDWNKKAVDVVINRTTPQVRVYAEIVRSVAAEKGVPVFDQFAALEDRADDREIYTDGLHLSKAGYDILFERFIGFVAEHFPDHDPLGTKSESGSGTVPVKVPPKPEFGSLVEVFKVVGELEFEPPAAEEDRKMDLEFHDKFGPA